MWPSSVPPTVRSGLPSPRVRDPRGSARENHLLEQASLLGAFRNSRSVGCILQLRNSSTAVVTRARLYPRFSRQAECRVRFCNCDSRARSK